MNIRRFNPFRSLPNAREVWAWGMYDLANQSFTLLITTLFFGIYFSNVVVGDEGRGQLLYGRAFAISSLLVVITSPFLGALADFSGRKKAFLTWLGIGCSLFTMALAIAGPDDTLLAMTLFIAANVCFMGGENFLAAFLPELSTRQTIGRVSAIGWTMGYLGALICLPMALLIPGLRDQTIGGFRGLFLFAGAWFLINALPTMLLLRERKQREVLPAGATLWTIGFLRVLDSARQAGRFRQLTIFLTFFTIYCCGMQVIIVFSGIIASKYLSPTALIAFVFVLAAVSAVGSAISGLYQDRIGQRLTVQVSLLIWIATSIGAVLLPDTNAPMWLLGLVGAGVGLGLGLTGAASRALVGVLIPDAAGGPPDYSMVMVPRGQFEIVDTWHVVGLRGTGSKDLAVRAAHIPAHRIFSLSQMLATGYAPGLEVNREPEYTQPFFGASVMTLVAPALGAAHGAIDRFAQRLGERVLAFRETRQGEHVPSQLRLAQAMGHVDAAELLIKRDSHEMKARAVSGETSTLPERARYRFDNAWATRLCAQAVDLVFEASGGGALQDSHPIQRAWRDVHAIANHAGLNLDTTAELLARVRLGLPPNDPVI